MTEVDELELEVEREELDVLDVLLVEDVDDDDDDVVVVVVAPHEAPLRTENCVEYWYSPVPSTMMSMP